MARAQLPVPSGTAPPATPPQSVPAPIPLAPVASDSGTGVGIASPPGSSAVPGQAPAAPGTSSPETPLPGSGSALAGSPGADPNQSVILDNADTFRETTAGQWTGEGHVKVRYKGYTLTSDRVDADLDVGDTLFTGHVILHAPNGETVQGGPAGRLRLNLRHDTYSIEGARSTIGPDALNAQSHLGIILPLFVYGGTISGQPGLIDARGSSFTTCDFLSPHYSFAAHQVYILPGRHLVARRVSFYRKDRRLFTIPYLFVPLNERFAQQTLFPQVGQTPDEGLFIKFALGYALVGSLPGILHLDALQKKGLGTGFDQTYGDTKRLARGAGTLSLYRLYDQSRGVQNITGSLAHQQKFGTVLVSLNTQLQQNSYYAGLSNSRAQNSFLTLTRSVGNLSDSVRANLTQSDYGLGSTQTLTSSFDQTYRPTGRESLETHFDLSSYRSPSFAGFGGSSRRELDSNLDYKQRGNRVDVEVLGAQFQSLSGSATGNATLLGGVERLPELRLATDGTRETLGGLLPRTTQLNLSLGDFVEPSSKTSTERLRFGLDTGTMTHDINSRNEMTYGGAFQQGIYGDNTAQYVLNGRTGYRLRIGSKSSIGAAYTYLRPYGYSPFVFDTVGSSNLAALSLDEQESDKLRLTLATGYDFNQTHGRNGFGAAPWQNVAFQSAYTPSDVFRLRTTAAYDLNHNALLDLTNSVRVRVPQGLSLDVAGRFSPQEHVFSEVNGNVDLPFLRDPTEDAGYRLRAIGGYNGFTKRFEYKGLALTRSWHDFEASLIYQDTLTGLRPGSGITFNFRLKAFPAEEPFAIGQFGQSLDTSLGEVY